MILPFRYRPWKGLTLLVIDAIAPVIIFGQGRLSMWISGLGFMAILNWSFTADWTRETAIRRLKRMRRRK